MREMDYLHVIDWKKAMELVQAGKAKTINGIRVLPLSVAAAEGVIYFVPESKSPHGVDLVPGGEYVTVSGKLDPHVSVYAVEKIKKAIEAKNYEGKDPYGINILKYDACLEAHVAVGLGPLHSVFDDKGYGYTSLFLDSAIAKWSLGGDYQEKNKEAQPWKVVDKVSVHYNVGHLQAPGSNTRKPVREVSGLAQQVVGGSLPAAGPAASAEPPADRHQRPEDGAALGHADHRRAAQLEMMPLELLQPWTTYPETGWDPVKMTKSAFATEPRARSGSSARATRSTSTAPSSARTTRPTSCG